MATAELRVLLVEDSRILAEKIVELLSEDPVVRIVGVVATEDDAICALQAELPDAVVLDLRLAEGSGFGVLTFLRGLAVRPRVVVMSNYVMPAYRQRVEQLGADWFLDKSSQFGELPGVLHAWHRG